MKLGQQMMQEEKEYLQNTLEVIGKEIEKELYAVAEEILNKSYRSTCEIHSFAQRIYGAQQQNISFDRRGRAPEVRGFAAVVTALKQLRQEEADLITLHSQEAGSDTVMIPAYLAKGLEFDGVLGYNISEDNYSRELDDRRLLYILCTRALHRLDLFYAGRPSPFAE
jgi:DNA helicase-2/ATP-dependent DNA helicase PcrA